MPIEIKETWELWLISLHKFSVPYTYILQKWIYP